MQPCSTCYGSYLGCKRQVCSSSQAGLEQATIPQNSSPGTRGRLSRQLPMTVCSNCVFFRVAELTKGLTWAAPQLTSIWIYTEDEKEPYGSFTWRSLRCVSSSGLPIPLASKLPGSLRASSSMFNPIYLILYPFCSVIWTHQTNADLSELSFAK